MTINNAMRDYAIITFNMHKGTKSYKEMAAICQMSETTFGDVIRTDNAVANKNWDYIVKSVDDKKRSKDNIIYSAKRHGWGYDNLIKTAREKVKQHQPKTEIKHDVNLNDIAEKLDKLLVLLEKLI